MSDTMNPDAGQDERLILECMQRELVPVFQTLMSRIEMLESDNEHLKKLTNGIVDGFGEAVSSHRRGQLSSSLDLGEDYDNVNSVYSDLEGSDLKEDFIDHLMENDVSDEQIEEMKQILMENARSKYGKYKRFEPEAPADMGDGGEGVLAVDIGIGKPDDEEAPEEDKKNPVDAMRDLVMSQHKSKRGSKL